MDFFLVLKEDNLSNQKRNDIKIRQKVEILKKYKPEMNFKNSYTNYGIITKNFLLACIV